MLFRRHFLDEFNTSRPFWASIAIAAFISEGDEPGPKVINKKESYWILFHTGCIYMDLAGM